MKKLLPIFFALFLLPVFAHASTLSLPGNNLGLVGYWSFNEGTSTIAHDFSGGGYNGTLSTTGSTLPAWTGGKLGNGLSFDGSSSYVDLGTGSQYNFVNTTFTVSAWVKFTAGSYGIIVSNFQGTGGGWGVEAGTGLGFDLKDSSGHDVVEPGTSAAYNDGKWHQVVVVITTNTTTASGNTGLVYVDGQLQTSGTATTYTYTTPPSPHNYIGRRSAGTYFNGSIDEVRIYNRGLSAAEVAGLYQAGYAKINASQSPGTLSNGLVGWWTMDGADTVWSSPTAGSEIDKSGNGNTGTLENMNQSTSPTIGKIGQAMAFNGTDQEIDTTTEYTNPQTFTLSVWFKTTVASGNKIIGFENAQSGTGGTDYDRQIYMGTDGKIYFAWYTGALSLLTSSAALNDGNWHNAVATYDGTGAGTANLYIDGVLQGTNAAAGAAQFYAGWWRIGSYKLAFWTNGSDGYFTGSLDDVRIYNRALSASEVGQLYNLGAGTHVNTSSANLQDGSSLSSGLTGLWTFDGPTLNWVTGVASDSSGNGNNGQMIGMSTTTSPVIGKLGQALKFDGVSSYINNGSWTTEQTTYTVSLWFKTPDPLDGGTLFYRGDYQACFYNPNLIVVGGVLDYQETGCSSVGDVSDTATIATSTWYNAVLVRNGNTKSLYLNDVLIGSVSGSHSPCCSTANGKSLIGAGWGNTSGIVSYFPGTIDDVRIYNRALSASEIQQLYNMGK